jgi:hypothetical protein
VGRKPLPKTILSKAKRSQARVVEVIWVDAVGDGDWTTDMEGDGAATASVGYLVSETKAGINLVGLVNPDDAAYTLFIPRGMIEDVRYLR